MESVQLWNDRRWNTFEQSVYCSGSPVPPQLAEIFHRYEWEKISKVLPITNLMEVLDIGAGGGRWTVTFAPLVSRVVALEPTKAYDVLRRNTSPYSNVDCYRLSFQEYQPTKKFDLVIISGVLMYVSDDAACTQFLRSALEMVSPGGYLLLREPVLRKARRLREGFPSGEQHPAMSYWEIYRARSYYTGTCEEAGFRTLNIFPNHATVFYHLRFPMREGIREWVHQAVLRVFSPTHMKVWRLYNLLFCRLEELIRFLINDPKIKIMIFHHPIERTTPVTSVNEAFDRPH